MKHFMKLNTLIIAVAAITFALASCNKDEMEPPIISFKTGAGYTSDDITIAAGSSVLIGIEASKAEAEGEEEDVLSHFNISLSVNGGASTSVYDADMTAAQEEEYSYDYNAAASTTVGEVDTYTFTITNRDGLTGQVSLNVTSN